MDALSACCCLCEVAPRCFDQTFVIDRGQFGCTCLDNINKRTRLPLTVCFVSPVLMTRPCRLTLEIQELTASGPLVPLQLSLMLARTACSWRAYYYAVCYVARQDRTTPSAGTARPRSAIRHLVARGLQHYIAYTTEYVPQVFGWLSVVQCVSANVLSPAFAST